MDTQNLIAQIKELRELQALIAEATEQAETIKDRIKRDMGEREEVRAGEYKITYKVVVSPRLDSKSLKDAMPEVYRRFCKDTVTRPFKVS